MGRYSNAKRWLSALGRLSSVPLALCALVSVSSGCNQVLGIDDPQLLVEDSPELSPSDAGVSTGLQDCVLTSDCNEEETHVCIFSVCSPECASNRDCSEGSRCINTEAEGPGCVAFALTGCGRDGDCPSGSACADGECRNPCEDDEECLGAQRCDDGICVGTDPEHEAAGAGEGDESDGDGATDEDDEQDSDAETDPIDEELTEAPDLEQDEEETDAPALSDEETPPEDDPDPVGGPGGPQGSVGAELDTDCEEDGMFCDGYADVGRHQCAGGMRQPLEPCTDGQLCDSSSATAECADVAPECVGRQPGEAFCDGSYRTVCGPDLVDISSSERCDSVQLCNAGNGADCGVCLDNTFTCEGAELRRCREDHSGFEFEATCDNADECNADAGACTPFACLPGQRRCAANDELLGCTADQMSFDDLVEDCGDGLCNSTTLSCNACQPNDVWCDDAGTGYETCSSDGQDVSSTSCPMETPLCIGQGQCVECTQDTHCDPTECYVPTCNSGSGACTYVPASAGVECSTGLCNGAGACVECVTATDCAVSNACYAAACNNGVCEEDPLSGGTTCSFDSGTVCDGEGACVECVNATNCATTNACYSATCSVSNDCGEEPVAARVTCSFDGGTMCDGEGACVECVAPADCDVTNLCYTASCESGTCGEVHKSAGSDCSFDGGSVCNGSGSCVQCVSASDCTASSDCWTATCGGNTCDQNAKSPGVACTSSGGNVCDGSGNCIECINHGHCGSNEYCDGSGVCQTNVQFQVGYTQTSGGSEFVPSAGFMWATRIEVTEDINVASIGLWATAAGGSAKMFIYSDDGGEPGAYVAATATFPVGAGSNDRAPQPAATSLAAGFYWIAATFSGSPELLSHTVSGSPARRINHEFVALGPDPFDELDSPIPYSNLTFNFHLWATIDTN